MSASKRSGSRGGGKEDEAAGARREGDAGAKPEDGQRRAEIALEGPAAQMKGAGRAGQAAIELGSSLDAPPRQAGTPSPPSAAPSPLLRDPQAVTSGLARRIDEDNVEACGDLLGVPDQEPLPLDG
ncbi:MAG: hypothetical protein FJ125_07765, partial [Deltaproteobacteria bacterium]|nr:hypothetical protein [Deltaproteobacteria bacterium]